MRRKGKNKFHKFPAKYVLLIMGVLCAVIIACSTYLSVSPIATTTAASYVIIPMQRGINYVGNFLYNIKENFKFKNALIEENSQLKAQLADVQEELNNIQLDREELDRLKNLYDMDQAYSDYDKLAANVVGKDAGNWFSTFIIDKGRKDGVEEGMNVIADGGLAGIVIEVGVNYAKVRSIIDDNSSVSGKDLSTSDICIVAGSLMSMNENSMITFSDMRDDEGNAETGDLIVVSNISDMFLDGIPIGYITTIDTDANNLTKSGYVATIVDFEHLENVFVILETKDITDISYGDEEE